ncbi:uncharacterized protein LOC125949123 isoform X2 [Anopheles darlingi]|nr:uncharacterized protein LOC125949123 isoform X2 [Anopheles darlingi]XP_049531810.1 uncharacterized protein LOC125949123 isoform X2 [Anopheles darlingi]
MRLVYDSKDNDAEDNNSRTQADIEKTLKLNATNSESEKRRRNEIMKCIMKILENGVQDESIKQLLEVAVVNGNLNVTEMLVEPMLMANENRSKEMNPNDVNKYLAGLLEKCCNRGYDNILKFLLSIIPKTESDFINEHPLLCCVIKEMNPNDSRYPSFEECLRLLLKDRRVMIDRAEVSKRTPLYYAAGNRNDLAQIELLKKGACLGTMDIRRRMPVDYIDPFLLEEHLNTCITDNGQHLINDGYELTLDFKNFIPKQGSPLAEHETQENQETRVRYTRNRTDSVAIENEMRNSSSNQTSSSETPHAEESTLLMQGGNGNQANASNNETSSSETPHAEESTLLMQGGNGNQANASNNETSSSETPHAEESSLLMQEGNESHQIRMESTRPEIHQQLPESELSTILELAQESANQRILQHPVISCILAIKQADLCWFRRIYCLYYLTHYVILMGVWIGCNYAADNCVAISIPSYLVLMILMVYMTGRCFICVGMDFVEFCWTSKFWRRFVWRWIQLIPISLLIEITSGKPLYPWISAISMIVLAIEFTLLLSIIQWLSISTNVIMFKRVLYTFCESLLPFLPIIMGCLLSFHILFRDTSKNESASQDKNTTQAAQNVYEKENTSNEFQTIVGTSRKMFSMMAGDLNTEKLDFQTVPRVVMFSLFVVIIVIVLNNFANSLAVDDTLGLRAKSQFLAIKQDVKFMQKLETILKILERYKIPWCSSLVLKMLHQIKPLPPRITIKLNEDDPLPVVRIDRKFGYICKTIIQKNEHKPVASRPPVQPAHCTANIFRKKPAENGKRGRCCSI